MPSLPPNTPSLGQVLERLVAAPGVSGALAATRDGLPVAVQMEGEPDSEAWAAMAAMLGSLAERLLEATEGDEMTAAAFISGNHQFTVRPIGLSAGGAAERGFLLATAPLAADGAALCAVTQAAAEELEAAARDLTERDEE